MEEKLQKHKEILKQTCLGIWEIYFNPEIRKFEMYADDVMREIMGIKETLTPEECYWHWYSRINEGYYGYINMAINTMIESKEILQVEYTWKHPQRGEVGVRSLGRRGEDKDGKICIRGYHRIISDIKHPQFLPDGITSEMFEYHEKTKTIYFHTNRSFITGTSKKEKNFPECWIQNGIVHPHFADAFRELFYNVPEREEIKGIEILMMTAQNNYEWVKVRTRHLGQNEQDLHTVIVILDPANQKRILELEYRRQNDFYQAMLSETAAYAEVDVESGHLMKAGGLWGECIPSNGSQREPFHKITEKGILKNTLPENRDEYRSYLDIENMKKQYREGRHTRKYSFQRIQNNTLCWMELTVHVFEERDTENMYALLYLKNIDIAKKRELEQEMAAMRDPLTNVFNRRSFEQEVNRFMIGSADAFGTMLLLDMDDFKKINDKYGHLEGDEALQKLTDILMCTFRKKDVIGRLGGDEFVVFIKGVRNRELLARRMEQLYEALQGVEGRPITCSVGIAIVEKEGFSYQETLRQADEALYHSKQKGKNQYCYYEKKK